MRLDPDLPHRTRWDQRGMAALAVVYVVMLYGMTSGDFDEPDVGAMFVIEGVILAMPQLARRRDAFAVACLTLAVLVFFAGGLLVEAGFWIFLPTLVPLLLAMIRIPERWTAFVTPFVLAGTTAALAVGAYVFSIPARTW